MANIIDNLNILDQNLDTAKTTLANNLTAKGVPSTTGDTLTAMADKVAEISGGGGSGEIDFAALGIKVPAEEEQKYQDGYKNSQQIITEGGITTPYASKFFEDKKILFFPYMKKLPENDVNKSDMFGMSSLMYFSDSEEKSILDGGNNTRMFCGCVNLKKIFRYNPIKFESLDEERDYNNLYKDYTIISSKENGNFVDMFNGCHKLKGNFYLQLNGNLDETVNTYLDPNKMTIDANPSGNYDSNITVTWQTSTALFNVFANTNIQKAAIAITGQIDERLIPDLLGTFESSTVEEVDILNYKGRDSIGSIKMSNFSPFWNCHKLKKINGLEKINASFINGIAPNCENLEEISFPVCDRLVYNFSNNSKLKKIKIYTSRPPEFDKFEGGGDIGVRDLPASGVVELYGDAANNPSEWEHSELFKDLRGKGEWWRYNDRYKDYRRI